MTRTLSIDFVSDVVCPWCVVGLGGLEQALATVRAEGIEATVTFQPPWRNADCSCCSTRTSQERPVSRHSKSSASSSRRRSPDGSCMSGCWTST